ncbi:MAG: hypothetical protein JHD16_06710 [Solirubrobacteraceae bacterium]|nr:hypothetical protein [Solirubrobacteraceae bacterium]
MSSDPDRADVVPQHAVVAYIPVLHEGYRRFLHAHAAGRPFYVIGRELYADYRPLAKDIRALDPELVASAIAAWGVASSVSVLDEAGAAGLAEAGTALVMPSEDVSYLVAERYLPRNPVTYDSVFLRWDKRRSVELLQPPATRTVSDMPGASGSSAADGSAARGRDGEGAPASDPVWADLAAAAETEAGESIDWWRQVGAALRLADGTVLTGHNALNPTPQAAYAAGDPRSNFFKGVHLELSLATHAEAGLIAAAARDGRSTQGASIYVTDFPCPPCAKLIAGAGIERVYFRQGYAVLDGADVLQAAGVEIVHVGDPS